MPDFMRNFFRTIFDFKIFLGAFFFASLLFFGLIIFLLSTRDGESTSTIPTVVLNIMTAPPLTSTPINPTSEVIATPILNSTETTYGFQIEDYVQVTGTEGDGLRLRVQPGLDNDVQYLASDGEVFLVKDGPREASDFIWWLLQAPIDQSVSGWAVGDFLTVIETP
jgi:hypothetical protein